MPNLCPFTACYPKQTSRARADKSPVDARKQVVPGKKREKPELPNHGKTGSHSMPVKSKLCFYNSRDDGAHNLLTRAQKERSKGEKKKDLRPPSYLLLQGLGKVANSTDMHEKTFVQAEASRSAQQ